MTQIVNKLDGGAFPLDGFDNDPNFRMVPLGGGMRDVVFTTARSPAVLKFSRPNIAIRIFLWSAVGVGCPSGTRKLRNLSTRMRQRVH